MRPGLRTHASSPETEPFIGIPGGTLEGDLVAALMHRHEVAAERLIGWLRVAIGACVFVTVIVASAALSHQTGAPFDVFERNAWIASLGFLAIGSISIVLAVPQRWHHVFAYLFMALDVGLVLAIACLAVGERALPGNALPSAPIVWAVPLVLAVGALRYDVKVQLCAIALLALGLVGIALGLDHQLVMDAAGETASAWPQLFSMPVNLMRFTLLLLAGAATALGIVRSRRLLASAVKDAIGRASLSRFLPAEIAPRLAAGDVDLRRARADRADREDRRRPPILQGCPQAVGIREEPLHAGGGDADIVQQRVENPGIVRGERARLDRDGVPGEVAESGDRTVRRHDDGDHVAAQDRDGQPVRGRRQIAADDREVHLPRVERPRARREAVRLHGKETSARSASRHARPSIPPTVEGRGRLARGPSRNWPRSMQVGAMPGTRSLN